MTASTCLHPYQNTRAIAGERDAFRFDDWRRGGIKANTLSPATSQSFRLTSSIVRDIWARADDVLSLNVGAGMLDCGRGAVPLNHP